MAELERLSLEPTRFLGSTIRSSSGLDSHNELVAACVGAGALVLNVKNNETRFFYSPPLDREKTSPGHPAIKVNNSSCVAISSRGHVAIGESGYQPRIVIHFPNGTVMASMTIHQFGVDHLAFSPDGNYLMSLGTPNDGYAYVWSIGEHSGDVQQHSVNRCISDVRDVTWVSPSRFVTVGVRHVRVWSVEAPGALTWRNAILREYAEAVFESVLPLAMQSFLVATSAGDILRLSPDVSLIVSLKKPIRLMTMKGDHLFIGSDREVLQIPLIDLKKPPNVIPAACVAIAEQAAATAHAVYPLEELIKDAPESLPIAAYDSFSSTSSEILAWRGLELSRWSSDLKCLRLQKFNEVITCVAQNEEVYAVGFESGEIEINGTRKQAHSGPVRSIAVTGTLVVSGGADKFLQVWNCDQLIESIPTSHSLIKVAAKDTIIACTTSSRGVLIFHNRQLIKSISLKSIAYDLVIWRSLVVISSGDRHVTAWNTETGEEQYSFRPSDHRGEPTNITNMLIIDEKNVLIGSGTDKSISLFSWPRGDLLYKTWGPAQSIRALIGIGSSVVCISDFAVCYDIREKQSSSSPVPVRRSVLRAPSPSRSPSRSPSPTRMRLGTDTNGGRITTSQASIPPLTSKLRTSRSPSPHRELGNRARQIPNTTKLRETALLEALNAFNSDVSEPSPELSQILRPALAQALNRVGGSCMPEDVGNLIVQYVKDNLQL